MTQPLTDDDKTTLKNAAYGVVLLTSNADPGFFDMVKESFAASKALSSSSGVVKEALTTGGMPSLPKAPPQETEEKVLPQLRKAMEILKAKAPAEAENYRATVLEAAQKVAEAAKGVSEPEFAELEKIKGALKTVDTASP